MSFYYPAPCACPMKRVGTVPGFANSSGRLIKDHQPGCPHYKPKEQQRP